jgi:hypothetical protein
VWECRQSVGGFHGVVKAAEEDQGPTASVVAFRVPR